VLEEKETFVQRSHRLTMETWELIAREEIRELVAQYAHLADGGRFKELIELFTEDAVLTPGDFPPAEGRDAIWRFLTETAENLRTTTSSRLVRHNVSNLTIELDGPDAGRGSAYFFVVTDRGPDHWGRYRDVYARSDGRWRFRSRRARLDGHAPGSWSAARNEEP
jgi:ketosteroid isomerase-like protein